MTQQLYEQTMDTQEGVVYLLLEEMAQQRIKEYLLAYALLLIKGACFIQHNAWTSISGQHAFTGCCLSVTTSYFSQRRRQVLMSRHC